MIADTLATRAAGGSTLVVVLHELGPFAPLIDRVLVLREGRLIHDGPPREMLEGTGAHDHAHHDAWPPASGLVPGLITGVEGGA